MKIVTRAFVLMIGLSLSLVARNQVTPLRLHEYLGDEGKAFSKGLLFPKAVKQFYSYHNFRPAWFEAGQESLRGELYDLLDAANRWGLNEKDYENRFEGSFQNLNGLDDSLRAEINLTDAALHFIHDVLYGNSSPYLAYDGLNYQPACMDIPLLLSTYLKAGKLNLLLQDVEPKRPEYINVKKKIIHTDSVIRQEDFREVIINSKVISVSNIPLVTKLYQLGILDSAGKKISDSGLKEKIRESQRLLGLLPDGLLRTNLLARLNVPLQTRLEELKQALNTVRW